MPRQNRGTPPGKTRGSRGGRGTGRDLDTSFMSFAGYTLQDEARNTECHHSFWDSDQKLRHAKVNFVSARGLDATIPTDPESALAEMSLESPAAEELEVVVEVEMEEVSSKHTLGASQQAQEAHGQAATLFIIDTQGSDHVPTGLPPPPLRPISPTFSNSSEEIILFAGRDHRGKGLVRNPKIPRTLTDPLDTRTKMVEDKIHGQEELLEEILHNKQDSPRNLTPEQAGSSSARLDAILPKRGSRQRRRDRRGRKDVELAKNDTLIADYIANMDNANNDLPANGFFNQRDLGGTESEAWQDETEASSGEPPQVAGNAFHDSYDHSDIYDFNDLSTSDGVIDGLQAILSKRVRAAGVQYLVVWEDQTVDEARWVPASSLTTVDALSHIETFEAEEKFIAEFSDDEDEDADDSDDMDMDEDEDNQDLVQRNIDRMTDEQIARLLAKQEELGMGSDEFLLFDDEADAEEDDDIAIINNKVVPKKSGASKQSLSSGTNRKGAKRPRGDFPAATTLADAYDGFDVIDFDRPSLKKKPKGRKGKPVFDISNSEPEASMQMTGDNNHVKKVKRKQEREKLRAQGLLGKKNGKPDLKEKYKEGMGVHAVKDEIKNFLMGDNTTLVLPPMDKAERKVVHELANAFNLKSKSAGNGNKRFPVLYRTLRTSTYVERTFAAVEARLTHRFLPRIDINGKRSGGTPKRSDRGGGGFSATVNYRDGDVVGGSAPELGVENKGRAMLEKMGWSTGTALGALNNKGILQPVSHVVKTTKAGLG